MRREIQRIETWKLKFDPKNARKHNQKNIEAIKNSLKSHGQVKPIVATLDKTVIAGNGTLQAFKELFDETNDEQWKTIDVSVVSMTKSEAKAFALADNRTAQLAEWDDQILLETFDELTADGYDLELLGFDENDIDMFKGLGKDEDDSTSDDKPEDTYTKKIKAPIYIPTGPKPDITELVDTKKTDELIKKINQSNLPKKEKDFLKLAAGRHLVFNYQNIAEYYAQSDAAVQTEFENSALVIIDFEKAIENGYVKLSKEVAEAYADDQ